MDDEGQSMISSENPDDNEGGMSDNDPDKDKDPGCMKRYEGDQFIWDQDEIDQPTETKDKLPVVRRDDGTE